MSQPKVNYSCQNCGVIVPKWSGQCNDCGQWNTLVEVAKQKPSRHYAGCQLSQLVGLDDVVMTTTDRYDTGLSELDRVLGGGLVPGAVVLLGGDPGIGKSTILLQLLANLSKLQKVLYVSGEESLQQIKLRALRLNLQAQDLLLLNETSVETILHRIAEVKPYVVVLDSIQTLSTSQITSAPGSVSQVRETTALLVSYAKQNQVSMFLIGHVTKDGAIAGPRVLEHMVDTVLYFEGDLGGRYRLIRAVKNRFGAVNELGVFVMADNGIKPVGNPSAIFLSRREQPVCGSVVMATWEGSRPMLLEVQALVNETPAVNPRRVVVGFDLNRLALILAVLQRHLKIKTYNQDVFVNLVGGIKITETAIDLPVMLAILSSLKQKSLPNDLLVFGEIGLSGEIRPVQSGQERLREAEKLGFKQAIIPADNAGYAKNSKLSIIGVASVEDLLQQVTWCS